MRANNPSQGQVGALLEHYQNGQFGDAESLAISITQEFPQNVSAWKILGAVLGKTGRKSEAADAERKAVALSPLDADAHYNLGVTLQDLGRFEEAESCYAQAIVLEPDLAEAHNNYGNMLKELGRLDEAEASCNQAIALKHDYAEAHNNLGNTLKELGRLAEAEVNYKQAIVLKPDLATAYWNLYGSQETIQSAEYWIDKCLEVDENYVEARLTKAALRFYQGDRSNFDELMQSELRQHPYSRSFAWVFSLPTLPELHFEKWHFLMLSASLSMNLVYGGLHRLSIEAMDSIHLQGYLKTGL